MEARVKTHTRLLRWQSHPNFLYSSPLTHPHVSLLSSLSSLGPKASYLLQQLQGGILVPGQTL